MPTTLPRHTVTEGPELARALDEAAIQWPEETSRTRLLLRLAEEGHRALRCEREDRLTARRQAFRRAAGSLKGVYRGDELAQLRRDWPE